MAEEEVAAVLAEAEEEMDKALRSLRIDLQKIRTGRANPALLDGVQVDYYGTPTPLNQLANLSAPEPRLIVISALRQGRPGDIERAIQSSDLGLTPANDGKVVRIPIPPLTEERRKELVKHVKKLAEDHKIGVREARRAALASLKELEGERPALGRAPPGGQTDPGPHGRTRQADRRSQPAQKEEEVLQV